MKYIRTPTNEIYPYDECEIFDKDPDNKLEVFFDAENQENLAKELFENTGILISKLEGGDTTG